MDKYKGWVSHLSWFVFLLSPLQANAELIPSCADVERSFNKNFTANHQLALYVDHDEWCETVGHVYVLLTLPAYGRYRA